jgi:hypothetical protein
MVRERYATWQDRVITEGGGRVPARLLELCD